jgi:hypothetical protein
VTALNDALHAVRQQLMTAGQLPASSVRHPCLVNPGYDPRRAAQLALSARSRDFRIDRCRPGRALVAEGPWRRSRAGRRLVHGAPLADGRAALVLRGAHAAGAHRARGERQVCSAQPLGDTVRPCVRRRARRPAGRRFRRRPGPLLPTWTWRWWRPARPSRR